MKNYHTRCQGVIVLSPALAKARGAGRSARHSLHGQQVGRACARQHPIRPPDPSLHQAPMAVTGQDDLVVIIILAGARAGGLRGGRTA